MAVVTVGGLAALLASAQEAARPFVETPLPPETWRRHVHELLLHGLAPGGAPGCGAGPAAPTSRTAAARAAGPAHVAAPSTPAPS